MRAPGLPWPGAQNGTGTRATAFRTHAQFRSAVFLAAREHANARISGEVPLRLSSLNLLADIEPASMGADEYVDIFFSCGPRENYGTPDYKSCTNTDPRNCSLWMVRWSYTQKKSLYVGEVAAAGTSDACPGGYSWFQAALSPGGSQLAVVLHCFEDGAHHREIFGGLFSADGGSGESAMVYGGTPEASDPANVTPVPQQPSWVADNVLWFSTNSVDPTCTPPVNRGSGWLSAAFAPGLYTPLMGPASSGVTDVSFQDAQWHPAPVNSSGGRFVSFGGACGELTPRVSDGVGGDVQEFDLDSSDPEFLECQHPAWNPSGDAILCTRQDVAEDHPDGAPRGARRFHRLMYDSGTAKWATDVAKADAFVSILTVVEFDTIPENGLAPSGLFPDDDPASPSCRNYIWKFGEWCGREDFVVATVFCSDPSATDSTQVLRSRVVLIDVSEGAPTGAAYVDLVSLVEDQLVLPRGTYDGIYATCSAVKS